MTQDMAYRYVSSRAERHSAAVLLESLEPRLLLSAVDGLIHTADTLLNRGANLAETTVGDQALFAGGGDYGNESPTSIVDIFNDRTGQWSTARLSQARSDISATTVGNLAMFAGGISAPPSIGGATPAQYSNVVDIYNARTGRWSTARLSIARADINAVTVGNWAIFAGGNGSNVVDLYNAATGRWSTATLSQARVGMAVATVGNVAIFAGGSTDEIQGVTSNVVDIFNADTGQWSTATLSQARADIAVTTVGDLAIFAGGADPYGPLSTAGSNAVDIYNAATNVWSTATLSVERLAIGAITVGKFAIFAGGENALGGGGNVVDIYDSSTGQWSTSTLPQQATGLSALAVGSTAIFCGGLGYGGSTNNAGYIYNTTTGRWSTVTLSQARNQIPAATVYSTAIFAGGFTAKSLSKAVDIFTAPSLSGSISRVPEGGRVSATLNNAGTSAFPGPDSVAVYASTSRTLDSDAVSLGRVHVKHGLDAGTAEQLSVSVSIPGNLPAGHYYLIAAAGPPHQLVQFAAQRRTFTVSPNLAIVRPSANNAASVFSTGLPISPLASIEMVDNSTSDTEERI